MHTPHEAGLAANFTWTMAGPGTVGGAAVPGDADQADVDAARLVEGHMRQPHDGGDAAEARRHEAGYGLIEAQGGVLLMSGLLINHPQAVCHAMAA